MKKIGITAGILLLAIIIGIMVIRVQEVDTDVTKKQTKVGVLLDGDIDDLNWNQTHYEALQKTAVALNLNITYRESVPEDESCEPIIEELISSGCKIIIANSFGFGSFMKEVAARHPDIYFYHTSGTEPDANLATFFGRMYQIRYLCGVAAGLQTETGKIGYVAAFPLPETNRGANAFTLGVRSVNPEATVYLAFADSWVSDDLTEDAARRLLAAQDIDVLVMHTDSHKTLDVAKEAGIWGIGNNMYNSALYPDTWLTGAVWNWEGFYEPRILECLQGKFQGKNYWLGTESNMMRLAPLSPDVKPGIKEAVEREMDRLNSKTFDIFYGPIWDREGNLRIGEGESMTDDDMLNNFDWYVEGIELCD